MFEGITAPRRNTRHRKSAMALALLLNFSGVGSLLTLGDVQSIIENVEDTPLIEVVFAPAPAPAAPPAAAFSPPSAPKQAIKPPKDRIIEEPAEPTEPDDVVDPTPTDTPEHTGDPIAAVGLTDGPESPGGCPPGMVCDGEPDAPGAGCPPGEACEESPMMFVTATDIQPRRRVRPNYPAAAKALNIAEARCLVRFVVDDKGRPTDVAVLGCPNVFHDEVLKAAWQWKFYPVRSSTGVKSAATFTLALNFRLN
ncbi:MAG: TonB family protein [Myxococcota bacterium]|jgi:TonB family protein